MLKLRSSHVNQDELVAHTGRGTSNYKCPEVGAQLVGPNKREEASVVGGG